MERIVSIIYSRNKFVSTSKIKYAYYLSTAACSPGLAALCFRQGACTGQPPLSTSIKVAAGQQACNLSPKGYATYLGAVNTRINVRMPIAVN